MLSAKAKRTRLQSLRIQIEDLKQKEREAHSFGQINLYRDLGVQIYRLEREYNNLINDRYYEDESPWE